MHKRKPIYTDILIYSNGCIATYNLPIEQNLIINSNHAHDNV